MNVLPAEKDIIVQRWKEIESLIDLAMPYMHGELDSKDIRDLSLSDHIQLFLVMDGDHIVSVAVTELIRYPQRIALRIILLAGSGYKQWDDQLDRILMAWALTCGADTMEANCRAGMSRVLLPYGYENSYVVMIKRLDKESP